jgi:hypothetical protein
MGNCVEKNTNCPQKDRTRHRKYMMADLEPDMMANLEPDIIKPKFHATAEYFSPTIQNYPRPKPDWILHREKVMHEMNMINRKFDANPEYFSPTIPIDWNDNKLPNEPIEYEYTKDPIFGLHVIDNNKKIKIIKKYERIMITQQLSIKSQLQEYTNDLIIPTFLKAGCSTLAKGWVYAIAYLLYYLDDSSKQIFAERLCKYLKINHKLSCSYHDIYRILCVHNFKNTIGIISKQVSHDKINGTTNIVITGKFNEFIRFANKLKLKLQNNLFWVNEHIDYDQQSKETIVNLLKKELKGNLKQKEHIELVIPITEHISLHATIDNEEYVCVTAAYDNTDVHFIEDKVSLCLGVQGELNVLTKDIYINDSISSIFNNFVGLSLDGYLVFDSF